jgi:competence protein ComEA
VKQNLPAAKAVALGFFLVPSLSLSLLACATLPRDGSANVVTGTNHPATASAAPLNINAATAGELEKLPGVGKVIAERIVSYRARYGPFRRPEHLMMVTGISDRKFRELRPMIVVE